MGQRKVGKMVEKYLQLNKIDHTLYQNLAVYLNDENVLTLNAYIQYEETL